MLHAALEVQVLEIVDVDVDRLEIERLENSPQLKVIGRLIIVRHAVETMLFNERHAVNREDRMG